MEYRVHRVLLPLSVLPVIIMMGKKRKGIEIGSLYKLQRRVCTVTLNLIFEVTMTRAATFCVLAILCFFGTGDAINDDGVAAMAELKSTTKLTTRKLVDYGIMLISDLDTKLSDQRNKSLTSIYWIIHPSLNRVRNEIDVAIANGKDAEHCYKSASLDLKRVSDIDANIELLECSKNAFATVNPAKSNVDATVLVGNRLINQLESINFNCLLFVHLNYQSCINEKMPRLNLSVKEFEKTVDELKTTGDSLLSSALIEAMKCNEASVKKVCQSAAKVRKSSYTCIANL